MVPHFTGRQKECEEITARVTSGIAPIVSIWGPPGFGKTSVAIAVGNRLESQKFPVGFLSLRGLQSIADVEFKIFSLFTRPAESDEKQQQRCLSIGDELSHLFSKISNRLVLILDHADDVLSGGQKMKDDFTQFLENVRAENVVFVITTREPLELIKDHLPVRICKLDESSSKTLVENLRVPNASDSDSARITQICGHIPLAIKALCSSISEGYVQPSKSLDDFVMSLETNNTVLEMLGNLEYASNPRLKLLFNYSYQRFSAQEK